MAELIIFIMVAFAIVAVVGYFTFKDMIESEIAARKDDENFENRRAIRQAEFDRHQKAIIHRCLIDTCETIYIGRVKNHE